LFKQLIFYFIISFSFLPLIGGAKLHFFPELGKYFGNN
jgi:hypothetical protein